MIIGIVFFGLCILSWQDYRTKRVNENLLILMVAGLLFYNIIVLQQDFMEILIQGSIGILLLIFSILWKDKIGIADGFVCMITGFSAGFVRNLQLMMIAFFLVSVVGIGRMIVLHKNKKESLAFIPFITVSYGFLCVIY